MSRYVDGFVLPVKRDQLENYEIIASGAGKIWMDHGALAYVECVGDDLQVEEMTPFPKMANASPEETVIFSWIVFESKEHRDQVNEAVMADPRMEALMPDGEDTFDYRRIAYGGFKTLVDLNNIGE
jgi:uncharacterized protein YbaA (DUF1428 family)